MTINAYSLNHLITVVLVEQKTEITRPNSVAQPYTLKRYTPLFQSLQYLTVPRVF